jgi:hypothetical protein
VFAPSTLEVLAGTPDAVQGLLGGLTAEIVDARADEGWSPRDVVAPSLAIEGPAFRDRVALMIDGDDPVVPNVDEHETLEASGYRERSLSELLYEFRQRRSEDVGWLRGLDGDAMARTGRHGEVGAVTVADVVHHIAYHDLVHIEQLTKMLQPRLEERRGNMRSAF